MGGGAPRKRPSAADVAARRGPAAAGAAALKRPAAAGGKRRLADVADAHAGDPGRNAAANSLEALRDEHLRKLSTSNFYEKVACSDQRAALQRKHTKRVQDMYKSHVEDARRSLTEDMDRLWREQLKDMFPRFICISGSKLSFFNGFFEFDAEETANGPDDFPVYEHLGRKCWLYMNQKRQWCISDEQDMHLRESQGWAHSAVSDSICPEQSGGWKIHDDDAWKPADIDISERSSVEIVVRSMTGEQLSQETYDPEETIRDVKSKLRHWKPGKIVRLTLRSRVLGDCMMLGSLGIGAGESLHAIFQERRGGRVFRR